MSHETAPGINALKDELSGEVVVAKFATTAHGAMDVLVMNMFANEGK